MAFIVFINILPSNLNAQNTMKPLNELINNEEPAWEFLKQWIDSARNTVEVLPVNRKSAEEVLYNIQVTTRSPMGAVVYKTGGILIDHGWIRILGSGSNKISRTLYSWNKGKTIEQQAQPIPYLLIADDAIGGFFLLNGGGLGNDPGKVYYFSPDNLEIEPLDISYTDFLNFCFNGNIQQFYEGLRWNGWEKEVEELNGDKVFSFFPYLWTKEGKEIEKNTKSIIPIEEQYSLQMELREKITGNS